VPGHAARELSWPAGARPPSEPHWHRPWPAAPPPVPLPPLSWSASPAELVPSKTPQAALGPTGSLWLRILHEGADRERLFRSPDDRVHVVQRLVGALHDREEILADTFQGLRRGLDVVHSFLCGLHEARQPPRRRAHIARGPLHRREGLSDGISQLRQRRRRSLDRSDRTVDRCHHLGPRPVALPPHRPALC